MSRQRSDGEVLIGCLLSLAAMLILFPLWLSLLIGVLVHIEAPTWVWVVFWCYAPVSFIINVALKLIEELQKP